MIYSNILDASQTGVRSAFGVVEVIYVLPSAELPRNEALLLKELTSRVCSPLCIDGRVSERSEDINKVLQACGVVSTESLKL